MYNKQLYKQPVKFHLEMIHKQIHLGHTSATSAIILTNIHILTIK